MKVLIDGINYDVEQTMTNDDLYGYVSFFDQTIYMNKNLKKDQQFHTLIHEVLEAINDANDLELEHRTLSVIANSFQSFIRNNLPLLTKMSK